ncbi:protein unc-119 homolog B-like [Limulus polyphemus]|uniref:Protein unc-119 homolog B-like n=1 Tax=Limulus polyphemus TaxID=6850 RepID=A0ABM1SMF6_LIMPO|nr:protein unc-119 homolog B-like [Limulus polyphemus]
MSAVKSSSSCKVLPSTGRCIGQSRNEVSESNNRIGNSSNTQAVTEEELLQKEYITPDEVLKLSKVTEGYLCSPEANIYGIDFTRFKIRDMETGTVLFEIAKPSVPVSEDEDKEKDTREQEISDPSTGRFVRYHFTPQFLKLSAVGATVGFTMESFSQPTLAFFTRKSVHAVTSMVTALPMDQEFQSTGSSCLLHQELHISSRVVVHLVQHYHRCEEMIKNPFQTRSDSFYFVDNKLIMHNKADYAYNSGLQ